MSIIRELIERMRSEFLNDTEGAAEEDFKWPAAALAGALNTAQKELAKRLHLIPDATTAEVCQVAIAKVDGAYPLSYPLSDKVLRIERLKYPGVTRPLSQVTREQMDQLYPYWETETGTPDAYMVDLNSFTVTFNRRPVADGVVALAVKRLPLAAITVKTLTASPELRQLDEELIHGALKYAYLRDDLETFDPTRAKVWAGVFEADIAQLVRDRAAYNPQATACRAERF